MKTLRSATNTILLIGSGRLAHHLQHWINLSKTSNKLLTWDRHQDPHLIRSYLPEATHVWLAISDSALPAFFEKYLNGYDAQVVHFSGAYSHPQMIAAHPLMTFNENLYADNVYRNIQFALTHADDLQTALPGFENSYFILDEKLKPLYHALCVVAGNFPQMLWTEVEKLCSENKIPFAGFEFYLHQVTENFIFQKSKALTGPFLRNDLDTIEKNIDSLNGTPLQKIYTTFKKEFLK